MRKTMSSLVGMFTVIAALQPFVLAGCAGNSVPDVSSKDLQSTVLELTDNAIRSDLVACVAPTKCGISADSLRVCGYPELKYSVWKEHEEENSVIAETVQEIDKMMEGVKLDLQGVRIIRRNATLGSIQCAGHILVNGEKAFDVEFEAQYTVDRRLYVALTDLS